MTLISVLVADVGACEYINNVKTKGDFEEQLHIEHSNLPTVVNL